MRLSTHVQALALAVGAITASAANSSTPDYKIFDSERNACPAPCDGKSPSDWTVYGSVQRLSRCKEPMLFDFAVFTPLDEPGAVQKIRACTAGDFKSETDSTLFNKRAPAAVEEDVLSEADLAWWSSSGTVSTFNKPASGDDEDGNDVLAVAKKIENNVADVINADHALVTFGFFKNTIIGIYVGLEIDMAGAVSQVFKKFTSQPEAVRASRSVVQLCGEERNAAHVLGVVTTGEGDLSFVQKAIKTWAKAECVATGDATGTGTLSGLAIKANPLDAEVKSRRDSELVSRAECRTIKVISGDGCGSLAERCGISPADFTKYNSYDKDLCSTLKVGQIVCCSAGTLPDIRPKPKPDGECFSYTTVPDDYCSKIAAEHGLEQSDLDEFNKKTWGWNGCDKLLVGQTICLSTGSPPLPAPVSNAVCGPTKPGTKKPDDDTDLADLNQCPLKVCCNIWGQCGTTKDFCIISESETGNPGTSKPGENGCISNCGMDIVNNDTPPDSFMKVAYYESWNMDRPCLTMDVRAITDLNQGFTHIHYSFINITNNFDVSLTDTYGQFENFKKMKDIKRIIAFGGWSFSVGMDTYLILRQLVATAENREHFATQVIDFLDKHDLDGVDFDWEYPGAADLPPGDPGDPEEADNYLKFLKLMREKLPEGKSLSIAAPASYWYLKPFPIAEISKVVDYIIYMTYDLHGQWDYESPWASDGCPEGSCLRSHVNSTETENALAMITKAGVEARKVVVGVTSYGRSFKMVDPNCKGPMCKFVGPESAAAKGECTNTAGYLSNAEINDIQLMSDSYSTWYDKDTDSDYMIYDKSEWVAYMTEETKKRRISHYKGLNFHGTSDWAVDLQAFLDNDYDEDEEEEEDLVPFDLCTKSYDNLEDIPEDIDGRCAGVYVLDVLAKNLKIAREQYTEVSKDYDDKFNWYVKWTKEAINPALDEFMKKISGEGNKYMDCTWWSRHAEGEGPCDEMKPVVPPGPTPGPRRYEYTMRDEEGFYKALLENHGIEKEWIEWREEYAITDPCPPCVGPPGSCPPTCGDNYEMNINYPRKTRDDSKIDVPNPKEIVDEAIPEIEDLEHLLATSLTDLRMGNLNASEVDAALAFAMPILMLEDAIESIKTVKEIGEEHKETKTKELVMNILSIVFMVIPFVGPVASALGGASFIARAALIIGEAANVGLTIAEIVDNPESAPFAILGFLTGLAGVRTKGHRQAFKDAADVNRALDSGKLKMFSEAFQTKHNKINTILKGACKL